MLTFRSLFLLLALAAPALALEGAVTGPARVIDGDTIEIGGQALRLFGIDAPEHDQTCASAGGEWACGQWSGEALARVVAGRTVACLPQDRDRYGRIVALCSVNGADLGEVQVSAGAAEAYLRYSRRYVGAESVARAAGAGIWSGAMERPEAFRAAAGPGTPPPLPAPADCAIKGNISANGRIYHRPGQHDYSATRIDPRKGEAWFCTEAEARAAGFRPARR